MKLTLETVKFDALNLLRSQVQPLHIRPRRRSCETRTGCYGIHILMLSYDKGCRECTLWMIAPQCGSKQKYGRTVGAKRSTIIFPWLATETTLEPDSDSEHSSQVARDATNILYNSTDTAQSYYRRATTVHTAAKTVRMAIQADMVQQRCSRIFSLGGSAICLAQRGLPFRQLCQWYPIIDLHV